ESQWIDLPDEAVVEDVEWVKKQALGRAERRQEAGLSPEAFLVKVRELKQERHRVIIVLHTFAGGRRKLDIQHYVEEFAVEYGVAIFFFGVDLAFDHRWDLADPKLIAMLLEMIEQGLIDIILGAPPCATWSDLSKEERARVTEANVLLFNLLALCDAEEQHGGGYLFEHPADPEEEPYPSVWDLEAVKGMLGRHGVRTTRIDQCMYGGPAQKPTTLASNLDGIQEQAVLCDGRHRHEKAYGKNERGIFRSRRLQAYPPGLCRMIALS
ncbi:unnamed protein product, partial [Prorocentrum cordatum]